MIAAGPILSVIVPAYNARETIRQCLQSLAEQTARSLLEVLVVDSSSDGTGDIVAEEFPWIRLIRYAERKYCGDARNAGLAQAHGSIIALIDADCIARKNWAEEILKAHQLNVVPAIGGTIANARTESLVGWAAYFCEFSAWMPGSPAGSRNDIAAANMSYKREIFDRCGIFIAGTYCSDTEFHWRLEREGLPLHFDPAIQVSHQSIPSLGEYLQHEFQHGRSFANVRVAARSFTQARRAAYAVLFGMIAAKLFLQIGVRNFKNAVYRKYFLMSLPLTLLGIVSWSLGEAFGYLGLNRNMP